MSDAQILRQFLESELVRVTAEGQNVARYVEAFANLSVRDAIRLLALTLIATDVVLPPLYGPKK